MLKRRVAYREAPLPDKLSEIYAKLSALRKGSRKFHKNLHLILTTNSYENDF